MQSAIGSGAINHQRLSGFPEKVFMATSNAWWSVEALDFNATGVTQTGLK